MIQPSKSGGGGIEINPTTIVLLNSETNMNNTSISVTEGKYYAFSYDNNSLYDTSVSGAEIIHEVKGSPSIWGSNAIYMYHVIIKATSNTIKITNGANRVFSLILVQLN